MFNEQELKAIQKAESAVKRARTSQIIGLVGMALLFALFISGNVGAENFAYALIIVAAGSAFALNSVSPSYAELVQILLSKRATNE